MIEANLMDDISNASQNTSCDLKKSEKSPKKNVTDTALATTESHLSVDAMKNESVPIANTENKNENILSKILCGTNDESSNVEEHELSKKDNNNQDSGNMNQNIDMDIEDLSETTERINEFLNGNDLGRLETPFKNAPPTPGSTIFTPGFTKALLHDVNVNSLETPKFILTPQFPYTPLGAEKTSFETRHTDYSTSSSYYQPSDTEQNKSLENMLKETKNKSEELANHSKKVSPEKIETERKTLSENETTSSLPIPCQHFESQLSDIAKKKKEFDNAQVGKKNICLLSKPTSTDDSVIMSSDSESTTSSSFSDESDSSYVASHSSSNVTVLHKTPENVKHQYSLRSIAKIDMATNNVVDTENVEKTLKVVNTEAVNKIISQSEQMNLKHMEMLKVKQTLEEKRKRIIDQLKMDDELKRMQSDQCKRKTKPSISAVRKKNKALKVVTKNGKVEKNQHVNTTKLPSTAGQKESLTLKNNEDTKNNDGVEATLNDNSTKFPTSVENLQTAATLNDNSTTFPTSVENIQTAVVSEINMKLPKCINEGSIKKEAAPRNNHTKTAKTKKKSSRKNVTQDVKPKQQTNENLKPNNLKGKVGQTLNKEKANIKSASLVTKEMPGYENKSVNNATTDDSNKEANALIRDLKERGIHLMVNKKMNEDNEIVKNNQIIDSNLIQSVDETQNDNKLNHNIKVNVEKLTYPLEKNMPEHATLYKYEGENPNGNEKIMSQNQHVSDINKYITHTNEKEVEESNGLINKELSTNRKSQNLLEEGELLSDDDITHDHALKKTAMSQLIEDLNLSDSVEDLDFDTITISQENIYMKHSEGKKVKSRSFDFVHKEYSARLFMDSGEIVRLMKVSQFEIILDIPLEKINFQHQSPLENIYTPTKQSRKSVRKGVSTARSNRSKSIDHKLFLKKQQSTHRNEELQTGNIKNKVDDVKSKPKVSHPKCKDNKSIQKNQTEVMDDNVESKVSCRRYSHSEVSSNKIVTHKCDSSQIEKNLSAGTQPDNSKTKDADNPGQCNENDDLMNYAICGSERVENETTNEDANTSTKRASKRKNSDPISSPKSKIVKKECERFLKKINLESFLEKLHGK